MTRNNHRNAGVSINPPAGALPRVPPRGVIAPSIDRRLTEFALQSSRECAISRNALYEAYRQRLDVICHRVWSSRGRSSIVEVDDLRQETFLIFTELLGQWPGNRSFSRYLLGMLPWRLRDAARNLAGPRTDGIEAASLDELADSSYAVEMALELLEELARELSPIDREILLLQVRQGRSVRAIAAELGVNRRTVQRRLKVAKSRIEALLVARAPAAQ